MKINPITWITIAAQKFYSIFDAIRINEDISDFIQALRSRVVVAILLLLSFAPLYPEDLQNVIELIKPII